MAERVAGLRRLCRDIVCIAIGEVLRQDEGTFRRARESMGGLGLFLSRTSAFRGLPYGRGRAFPVVRAVVALQGTVW